MKGGEQKFFFRVLVAQSRLRATKCDLLAKIWGVAKKCISHNFQKRSCPLERTDLSGQALCRKLWKIHFFCNTAIFTLFFFKWGSTSATSNSAENNPYHPLPYIFWTVWTWGEDSPGHQVAYKIHHTYKKNWANHDWVIRFLGIFCHFWAQEPYLHGKIGYFGYLSIYLDFSMKTHCRP